MCRDNVGTYSYLKLWESDQLIIFHRGTLLQLRQPRRLRHSPPIRCKPLILIQALYTNIGKDPTPPNLFVPFLQQDWVMNALGVNINYTSSNNEIYYAFQQTGDFVWPNFIEDLEEILTYPVRVSLIYGDADYICNWFGGQAVSLAVKYPHSKQFQAAGYTPLLVGGVEYGETREYGNFSFSRVYEAGHEVPYYQPAASLQLFNRTLFGWDIAEGKVQIWPGYSTNGTAWPTHTESFVPLPTATPSKGLF